MKKRLVSLLLICALMLGTFAFSAFATEPHTHDNCEGVCTAAAQRSINNEHCPNCGSSTAFLTCNDECWTYADNIATHYKLGYGNCEYTVYVSTCEYRCACGYTTPYEVAGATHYCDEMHECRGYYQCCPIKTNYSDPIN